MAIDLSSDKTIYEGIGAHVGHRIAAVRYGGGVGPFGQNVAIECHSCHCVLLTADFEGDEDEDCGVEAESKREG